MTTRYRTVEAEWVKLPRDRRALDGPKGWRAELGGEAVFGLDEILGWCAGRGWEYVGLVPDPEPQWRGWAPVPRVGRVTLVFRQG